VSGFGGIRQIGSDNYWLIEKFMFKENIQTRKKRRNNRMLNQEYVEFSTQS